MLGFAAPQTMAEVPIQTSATVAKNSASTARQKPVVDTSSWPHTKEVFEKSWRLQNASTRLSITIWQSTHAYDAVYLSASTS